MFVTMIHNKHIFFVLLFITFLSHSQTRNNNDSIFYSNVLKSSSFFFSQENFKKAAYYFSHKNWDSTLIYTQKQLNSKNQNLKIKNYCYLFRGISFSKKKVYNEAINQLESISKNFSFSNRIIYNLSTLNIEIENLKVAIIYLKQLEHIPNQKLIYVYKNDILNDLGTCYLLLDDFNNAERYLKKSYQNEVTLPSQQTCVIT